MTTVEKIKAKILDLAIRGKLVPQDPNDEPASVLLERIKAEKAELVKAKKIKKDKNPSEIIIGSDGVPYEKFEGEDNLNAETQRRRVEVPFNLPPGWAWARLGDVASYKKGPFGSALTKNIFVPKAIGVIKVYEQKNAIKKDASLGSYYISEEYFLNALQGFEVLPGDVIVSCAGTIGESYILPASIERGIINQALMRIRVSPLILIGYYLAFFNHVIKSEANAESTGSAMKNIPPFDILKRMLFPLPPIAEQKRIVAKVEELFAYADQIGSASEEITKTAQRLDKKILDLAIRGKLVPQDPNDEPASELVKRIEAARNEKTGRKKSRATASHKPTYEIEPLFDIPESWEWVKLSDLGSFVGGHTPSLSDASNWADGDILWVTSKDMKQKYISDTGCKVSKKGASELHLLPKGSLIMVTRSGILRRTFPIAIASKPLTINQDQRAIEFFNSEMSEYIYCCLKSFEPIILRDYRKTGTTVESIIWDKFIHIPIPLPPLAEQKRIVKKVDELKEMIRSLVAL